MVHGSMKQRNALYQMVASICRPLAHIAVSHTWLGTSYLPQQGGFILCVNHLTNIDPIIISHMLYAKGYTPQFLAKESLFKNKLAGKALATLGQIPVARYGKNASQALNAAKQALAKDSVIVIYPEGTHTRDPQRWPMKGKTGAARLALETKVPLIPVAQWGLLDFMPIGTWNMTFRPRAKVQTLVGKPVDLSAFADKEITYAVLNEATEILMADITKLLEKLRGEEALKHRWDMKIDGSALYDDHGKLIRE